MFRRPPDRPAVTRRARRQMRAPARGAATGCTDRDPRPPSKNTQTTLSSVHVVDEVIGPEPHNVLGRFGSPSSANGKLD